jgi:hypothetical protein
MLILQSPLGACCVSSNSLGSQMGIQNSNERVSEERLPAAARSLLDASSLCAIATVASEPLAYINTAYFAYAAICGSSGCLTRRRSTRGISGS